MAKHVTIFKMNVKPGKFDDLTNMMGGTADLDRIKALGWQSSVVGRSKDNANEAWVCVTWDTTENYRKNSSSPEQDEWFQKMRALLDADPEWHDCDVVEEQRA